MQKLGKILLTLSLLLLTPTAATTEETSCTCPDMNSEEYKVADPKTLEDAAYLLNWCMEEEVLPESAIPLVEEGDIIFSISICECTDGEMFPMEVLLVRTELLEEIAAALMECSEIVSVDKLKLMLLIKHCKPDFFTGKCQKHYVSSESPAATKPTSHL